MDINEAERVVRLLRTFTVLDVGSSKWVQQHDMCTRLNMQTHTSARTNADDYVLSACITFEKMGLLLQELLLTEAWRENVLPIISEQLAQQGNTSCMRAYFVLHHEEVLVNILESFLYHDYAAEALGDNLVDLVDYCARCVARLIALNAAVQSGSAAFAGMWDSGEALDSRTAAEMLSKDTADPLASHTRQLRTWVNQTVFRLGVTSVCILRYLSDYATRLPLSALTRLLDTHDVALLMVPLVENPPWVRKGSRSVTAEDGKVTVKTVWQKYVDHKWVDVEAKDLLKVTRLEGQPWLTLHALLLEPDCRRRYTLSSHRRGTLMRVRKYMNEVLTDQLPVLPDLQRMLDETAIAPPSESQDQAAMKAFLVETSATLTEAVCRAALTPPDAEEGRDDKWTWEQCAGRVCKMAFRKRSKLSATTATCLASMAGYSDAWPDSDDDGDLAKLGNLYAEAGFDEAAIEEPPKCAKCGELATKRCSRCHNEWYCGRVCQVAAWKGHKDMCDLVAADTVHGPGHGQGRLIA